MADVPKDLMEHIHILDKLFTVDTQKLKDITDHFISELDKGLSKEGGSIVRMMSFLFYSLPHLNIILCATLRGFHFFFSSS